jgi:hypothetical protein
MKYLNLNVINAILSVMLFFAILYHDEIILFFMNQ